MAVTLPEYGHEPGSQAVAASITIERAIVSKRFIPIHSFHCAQAPAAKGTLELRDDAHADAAGHSALTVSLGLLMVEEARPEQRDCEHYQHDYSDEEHPTATQQELQLVIHPP
jgi:hypothetical protein